MLAPPVGVVNPIETEGVAHIAAMAFSTCVIIINSAQVRCWGYGALGRLGTGSVANVDSFSMSTPIPFVPAEDLAKTLSGTDQFMCALFASGGCKCWGLNTSGQLGQGTSEGAIGDSPSEMSTLPYIQWKNGMVVATALSAGDAHACAVLIAGNVVCWGLGTEGQLGRDSTISVGSENSDMPGLNFIRFGTSDPALTVSAGLRRTCAVFKRIALNSSGQAIRCWGDGGHGKLGSNSVNARGDSIGEMSAIDYIQFSDTLDAVHVAAEGFRHTCAVFSNDRVRCFGGGFSGTLGMGSTLDWGFSPVTRMVSTVPYVSLFASQLTLGLTGASPASGTVAGGDLVTLTGLGLFTNNTLFTVRFYDPRPGVVAPCDKVDARGSFSGLTATTGLVTTPVWPCSPADVMVAVSWDGVDFNLTASANFSFAPVASTLTSAHPPGWPVSTAPPQLLVQGSGFRPSAAAVCRFGASTITPLTVLSPTTATCLGPNRPEPFALSLSVSFNNFTYPGGGSNVTVYGYTLSVTSLDVVRGPASGGTTVAAAIATSGLYPGYALVARFNLGAGRLITVSPVLVGSTVTVQSPPVTGLSPPFVLPGAATIEISLDGGLNYAGSAFEFYADPALLGVTPAAAPADAAAGVVLTIAGVNFASYQGSVIRVELAVSGSSAPASVVFQASLVSSFFETTLGALQPPFAAVAGPASLSLSLNGGRQFTLGIPFSFFLVTSISPQNGPVAGGTSLQVSGAGLGRLSVGPGFACRFRTPQQTLSSAVVMVTAGSLTCGVPAAQGGPAQATVDVTCISPQRVCPTSSTRPPSHPPCHPRSRSTPAPCWSRSRARASRPAPSPFAGSKVRWRPRPPASTPRPWFAPYPRSRAQWRSPWPLTATRLRAQGSRLRC